MNFFLCLLSSCFSDRSSGSRNTKPFINEFFFKLTDEKWLTSIQKRASDRQFVWQKRIIPRLHLFRKADLPSLSQHPVSEEDISCWMNAFGNMIEYIEQDKYERIYQPYRKNRGYLSGVFEPLHELTTTEKIQTTPRKCSVDTSTKCKEKQTDTNKCTPIKIAILDAFFDTDHHNLQCSIMVELAHNFVDGNNNPKPANGFPDDFEEEWDPKSYAIYSHGTMCMGRIASSADHGCNRGGDTDAHIIPLKFIDENGLKREENEIEALKYRANEIDIYSGSYGTRDNIGFPRTKLVHVEDALSEGVARGRGCKGSIYLFPSGNGNGNSEKGEKRLDNCNADIYANSVHTITIASITMSYNIANETEVCPCALVATFGSPDPLQNLFMNTTKPKDKCTFHFKGTSAATAYAAGMISHALRENANFSKRDIEHMLIQTADKGFDKTTINWQTNGAGYMFNERIGFGAINVTALKTAAATWQHIPEKQICRIGKWSLLTKTANEKTLTKTYSIQSDACVKKTNHVRYLEHVQLQVNISCSNISEVTLSLRSPIGTNVGLLTTIIVKKKARIKYENFQWTFMTVHFWGEGAEGEWILHLDTVKNQSADADIQIQALILHGTKDHPSVGGRHLECKNETDAKTSTNNLIIALIVAGSVVILISTVIVVCCYLCKKRERGCFVNRHYEQTDRQSNGHNMQSYEDSDARNELTANGSPKSSSSREPPQDEVPLNQKHLNLA